MNFIPIIVEFRAKWQKTSYFASLNDYFLQKSCVIQIFCVPLQLQRFFARHILRRKRVPTTTIKLNTLMRKLLLSMLILFSVATMATEQNVVAIYPLQGMLVSQYSLDGEGTDAAMAFYRKLGMSVRKTCMEMMI